MFAPFMSLKRREEIKNCDLKHEYNNILTTWLETRGTCALYSVHVSKPDQIESDVCNFVSQVPQGARILAVIYGWNLQKHTLNKQIAFLHSGKRQSY